MEPSGGDSGMSYSGYSGHSDYSGYSHYSDNTVIHDRSSEDKTADYVNYQTLDYLDNRVIPDQSLENKNHTIFNYGTINYFENHTEIKENADKSFYATRKFTNNFDECCYNHLGCVDATRAACWIGHCTLFGFGIGAGVSATAWASGILIYAQGAEGLGITLMGIGGVATCATTICGALEGFNKYRSGM